MGVNLWGEVSEFTKPSPLYVNPVNSFLILAEVLAEGKKKIARDCLEVGATLSGDLRD
jgi:hypothetical protein